MGRSPGFGSTPADTGPLAGFPNALFGLGFPMAPSLRGLNLPANVTRRFILQKARRRSGRTHRASTACRRRVSGSISLPSRGAFHLSLTVLVRYRWPGVFSLGGWSPRIPPGFLVSRGTWVAAPSQNDVPYRTITVSGPAFQRGSSAILVSYSVFRLPPELAAPTTLTRQRRQALTPGEFGLFRVRSPLLAESRLISLPRGTKMFQFPRFPSRTSRDPHPSRWGSCLIRVPMAPRMLAAPHGLSRCAAPFFGFWPQGIHPPPLVA
jgi:hypothetical protein